jgi:hypothetical protein
MSGVDKVGGSESEDRDDAKLNMTLRMEGWSFLPVHMCEE